MRDMAQHFSPRISTIFKNINTFDFAFYSYPIKLLIDHVVKYNHSVVRRCSKQSSRSPFEPIGIHLDVVFLFLLPADRSLNEQNTT